MSTVVGKQIVPDLRVSFNAKIGKMETDVEDAILECETGDRLIVSRRNLSLNSSFFRALFLHSSGSRNHASRRRSPRVRGQSTSTFPVYKLPQPLTGPCLRSILDFLTEQTVESLDLTEDTVADLATQADFLDLTDIVEECSEFVAARLSPSNVTGIWKFSQLLHLPDLERISFKYLCENYSLVCQQEEFSHLLADDLQIILISPFLTKSRQEDIWLSLTKWAQAWPDQRMPELTKLSLNMIFSLLPPEFLAAQVTGSVCYPFLEQDWATDVLLLLGGDNRDSKRILLYNEMTDRWQERLGFELPDPDAAPGDIIQAVTCPTGMFVKRSVNCYLYQQKTQNFVNLGTSKRRAPALVVRAGEILLLTGSFFTSWEKFCPHRKVPKPTYFPTFESSG